MGTSLNLETTPNSINRGVSILIFANCGVGKTTLSSSLPKEETLFVVTEAGIGPLLGKNFTYIDILAAMKNHPEQPLEEIISDLYKFLRTEKHPWRYVVIDNLTELENQLLGDYTRRRKKPFPEGKEYGDVAYRIHEWVVLFRDLQYQGITTIFNTWEKQYEMKSSTGESYTMCYPYLSGRNSVEVPGVIDCCGHLEVNEKTGKRIVRFSPSTMFLTKTQFQGITIEEPDLMIILSKINLFQYAPVDPVPVPAQKETK